MSYQITEQAGYVEITIDGEISLGEVLTIIQQLVEQDPLKERPDVWRLSAESMIPFDAFGSITQEVDAHCAGKPMVGQKTALVAANEFHAAQLALLAEQAQSFPFAFEVFTSEQDALQWIRV